MSRKRREQRAEAQRRQQLRTRITVGSLLLIVPVFIALAILNLGSTPEAQSTSTATNAGVEPPKTQASQSYLEHGLPEDDELARSLIRAEYYHFVGYTFYKSEADIPLRTLLVPDEVFSPEELAIIVRCVEIIGMADGADSPVFLALKDWAERKEDRIIKEIVPLDKKIAIGNGKYAFAFDAFWSKEMQMLYMGRHQLPYFMLFVSTLYQEAYHAVQLQNRELTLEANAEIEQEAHEAQLRFNRKLLEVASKSPESGRRFRLELEVINENLRESIAAYRRGLIERSGIRIKEE